MTNDDLDSHALKQLAKATERDRSCASPMKQQAQAQRTDLPIAAGIGCLTVLWSAGAICIVAGPAWLRVGGYIINIFAALTWITSSNNSWKRLLVGLVAGILGSIVLGIFHQLTGIPIRPR